MCACALMHMCTYMHTCVCTHIPTPKLGMNAVSLFSHLWLKPFSEVDITLLRRDAQLPLIEMLSIWNT